MRDFLLIPIVILGVFFIGFGIHYLGFLEYEFFEPKIQEVKHKTFKNTTTYIDGNVQDLIRYRSEYMKATDDEKAAIKVTIQQMYANFDEKKIESDIIREFLIDMKYN